MKKLLNLLAVSILAVTASTNLINTKVMNFSQNFKKNINFSQNNQKVQRYDSLNLVNKNILNNSINNAIQNINTNSKEINLTIDGKNYNYKDEILKIFSNKKSLLKTNNQYEQFLNQNNNYQKNQLGMSFPMNYDGVYFPWWGLGDYFYWYMSSNTVKKIQQFLGWSEPVAATAIMSILTSLGIIGAFAPVLTLMLMTLPASFYLDNVPSYDNGNGVYVGISILPSPIIFEVGSQDKYISKVNSFEVDYKFTDNDYITACVDEQGVNILLNYYYNYKPIPSDETVEKDNETVNNLVNNYLKKLSIVDKTGLGGSITNQDYTDWANTFLNVNSWSKLEHLQDFVNKNNDFHSIDIRTQRGNGEWGEQYYSQDYEIWKNS